MFKGVKCLLYVDCQQIFLLWTHLVATFGVFPGRRSSVNIPKPKRSRWSSRGLFGTFAVWITKRYSTGFLLLSVRFLAKPKFLSGLCMVLTMAARIKSVVNVNTVDPSILCRVPAYIKDGTPSDKHVLRLVDERGPEGNVCVLLYGKVAHSNLRSPGEINNSRLVRQRGLVISAYEPTFERVSSLYAHVKGQKEVFLYPYGRSFVALTQSPEAVVTGASDVDLASGSESVVENEAAGEAMRRPLFSQDGNSRQPFTFKSPSTLLFDQKGVYCLFYQHICLHILNMLM